MISLVTGSSGFIGKHLVTALKKRGDTVVTIPHQMLIEPLELDAFMKATDPDYIFHLAAYGNMYNQKDIPQTFMSNLLGTFNLLQATMEIPYKSFINVSSSSVLLPHQTMYSATKRGAEELCRAYVDEFDKSIVTVRPFSVYGEGEADFRFIPTVFRSCMTGEMMDIVPDAVHDWIYIDDLISVLIDKAEDINEWRVEVFNAGTGKGHTNLEVMRAIEGITRKNCQYRFVGSLRSFDNKQWVNDEANAATQAIDIYEGLQKYYESIK